MGTILYAICNEAAEKYISERLSENYKIVGTALYKEIVVEKVKSLKPDILILSEGLQASDMSIRKLVQILRTEYPEVRIIFLAANRPIGDPFLEWLVNVGVYDIQFGESININEVVQCIYKPYQYKDVAFLQKNVSENDFLNEEKSESQPKVVADLQKEKHIDVNKKNLEKEDINHNNSTNNVYVEDEDDDETVLLSSSNINTMFTENNEEDKDEKKESVVSSDTELKSKVSMASIIDFINYIFKNKTDRKSLPNHKKVISVISAADGVGASTVASNIAYAVAINGEKSILVDLHTPANRTLGRLKIENNTLGLDGFINSILSGSVNEEAIVTWERISRINPVHAAKLCNKLDYLAYSQSYVMERNIEYKASEFDNIKELIQVLRKMGYINIILSVPASLDIEDVSNCVNQSSSVVVVTSQDTYSVSATNSLTYSLVNKDLEFLNKVVYVLNKYEKIYPKLQDVQQMFQCENIYGLRCDNKGFIRASTEGVPYIALYRNNISRTYHQLILQLI